MEANSDSVPPSHKVNRAERGEYPLLTRTKPRDQRGLAFGIMMLLGAGSLFPWNAFITCHSFYLVLFRGSAFQYSFMSIISTTFTLGCLIAIVALQKWQHFVPVRHRIIGCLAIELCLFVCVTVCIAFLLLFPTDDLKAQLYSRASLSFGLLLGIVGTAALAQATLAGSIMSYASIFGPAYLQAVSAGMGIAGLLVAAANLVTILPDAVRPHDAQAHGQDLADRATVEAAIWYFGSTCLVLLLCLLGFVWVECLEITAAAKAFVETSCLTSHGHSRLSRGEPPSCAEEMTPVASSEAAVTSLPLAREQSASARHTISLAVELWPYALALCITYSVTIGLFPAVASMFAAASDNEVWGLLFVPMLFFVYNLGDVLGRHAPSSMLPHNSTTVLSLSLLRLSFVPLFLMSHMRQGLSVLPVLIDSDVLMMLAILGLAITNGWLTTTIFIRAADRITIDNRAAASALMVGFLNFGLATGSLLSFLLRWIACYCNPFVSVR